MLELKPHPPGRAYPALALAVGLALASIQFALAGVTIITHGLNGNVDGWVSGMATNVPNYPGFVGTNFTCYLVSVAPNAGGFLVSANRIAGSPPAGSASGEIIVKLDWRDLADGNTYNTYQVATAVTPALLSTNFIPELGGHALAEFALHFIGHSRGGSLLSEVSRQLGTNGLWVDHLTTLDPHPLNDAAFPLDRFAYSAVDAPVNTYVNVLFHDNYWQNSDFFVFGKAVAGAFVRKLTSLNGGYSGTGGAHSDVHLWYHGTMDSRTPTTDTEATLTSAERTSWWTASEASGTNAGFRYSLIGAGDRTSTQPPVGTGTPMIRDGFNQWWELGAGVTNNRTALPANNGDWPNLIKFNRTTTNSIVQGQSLPVTYYYQWARPSDNLATISFYLDPDLNPLNTNHIFLRDVLVPGTGAGAVGYSSTNLILAASNTVPGSYAVLAKITANNRARYLYAPEHVQIVAAKAPPALTIFRASPTGYRIVVTGPAGQTTVLQSSLDLLTWASIATNTMPTGSWEVTNPGPDQAGERYFRGVVP